MRVRARGRQRKRHTARERQAGGAHEAHVRLEVEASLNEPARVRRTLDGASALAGRVRALEGQPRLSSLARLAVGMGAGHSARGSRRCPRAPCASRGGHASERACARAPDGASALVRPGMDAGGAGGGPSGGAGEPWVATARSARHAVLLAIQALGVNEAAVREARAASDAIRAEIE